MLIGVRVSKKTKERGGGEGSSIRVSSWYFEMWNMSLNSAEAEDAFLGLFQSPSLPWTTSGTRHQQRVCVCVLDTERPCPTDSCLFSTLRESLHHRGELSNPNWGGKIIKLMDYVTVSRKICPFGGKNCTVKLFKTIKNMHRMWEDVSVVTADSLCDSFIILRIQIDRIENLRQRLWTFNCVVKITVMYRFHIPYFRSVSSSTYFEKVQK